MVAARRTPQHQRAEQERGGVKGASDRVLSQRQLPGSVQHPRDAQVHEEFAWEVAGDVAGGALSGGGEVAGEGTGAGG